MKDLLAMGVPAKNLILVSRTPETLAHTQSSALSPASATLKTRIPGRRLCRRHAHAVDQHRHRCRTATGGPWPRHRCGRGAGVKQIAYTSWLGISKGDNQGIAVDHVATEELLRRSSVAYTFLRNSIYMESLLPQVTRMLADGKATVPEREVLVGYVTRGDCAAAAAAVLATPGHDNKIYDITGPTLIGVREIAAAATAVTGKAIALAPADPNAPPARSFAGPALAFTSTAVADLTGRPGTSIQAFLAANSDKLGVLASAFQVFTRAFSMRRSGMSHSSATNR